MVVVACPVKSIGIDHEASTEPSPESQSMRIDPDTLVAAIRYLERQAGTYGARFDVLNDYDLLAKAYEVEARERAGLAPDNLLSFGDALRKRMAERAGKHDKGGTGSTN